MANSFLSRLKTGWNAFKNRDPTDVVSPIEYGTYVTESYGRPDRRVFRRGHERSIVTVIYNRIAIDVSSIDIRHVRVDENKRYIEEIDSRLNNCLSLEANIDQTSRAFIQDVVQSMLDDGVVAIVPIDTDVDPNDNSSFDIQTMRVGKIVKWFPRHVEVDVYNDRTGYHENVLFAKEAVCIIENPLYSIINEPNSMMQRLIRKLMLLDSVDEQTSSSKLDLIIQLPYVVKTKNRQDQAERRRREIEEQLNGSKYGIAYTDGTEKITQLNRPVENTLLGTVEYLTNLVYAQLGLTQSILDGTADERAINNYFNRTIEPITEAIVLELKRKFLTKTARTQGQSIIFIRDPFKLVPVDEIAEIADKFTRNEIATTNEIRAVIGWKPSNDQRADMLLNKNLNHTQEELESTGSESTPPQSSTKKDTNNEKKN